MGWDGFSARLGFIRLTAHDPIRPLLVALISAVLFLLWTAITGRPVRRTLVVAWLGLIGGVLLIAVLLAFFASAADAYPIGDGAVIEIYTLHAVRGIWKLGPYSQFGWNHPGPLFFYLLAPLYVLSGEKTIALQMGAFAINLISLLTIVMVLTRSATSTVACAGMVALAIFLFRLDALIGSYWNPHVVVLPVAALLVLCAALAAGRRGALPAIVVAGSFLSQTHVSLVPYVIVLASAALAAAVLWRARATNGAAMPAHRRSLGWWINLSAWLLLLLWLFPIVDQLSRTPGNLTSLARFFTEPADGQPWSTALIVWGDVICALFRPGLTIPVGWVFPIDGGYLPCVFAALQLLLLAAGCWNGMRRGDRFDAALCAAGILASLTALWSVTRIRTAVGDYMVFWMSVIGAMNWAVIAGIAASRFLSVRLRDGMRWAALGASAIVTVGFVYVGVSQLEQARRQGFERLPESANKVKLLTEAVADYLQRQRIQRPLFQVAGPWGEAAGMLLQLYRRGVPFAVSANQVSFYGEPFAPTGREDRVFVIADPRVHDELAQRAGDELVAHQTGVYVHAAPNIQP